MSRTPQIFIMSAALKPRPFFQIKETWKLIEIDIIGRKIGAIVNIWTCNFLGPKIIDLKPAHVYVRFLKNQGRVLNFIF